jgi:hypothetical protein
VFLAHAHSASRSSNDESRIALYRISAIWQRSSMNRVIVEAKLQCILEEGVSSFEAPPRWEAMDDAFFGAGAFCGRRRSRAQ